jgi:hypothetical protein
MPIAGSRGRASGARQPVEKREAPRLRTVPLPLVPFFWCTIAARWSPADGRTPAGSRCTRSR